MIKKNLPQEEYLKAEGVSASELKMVLQDPSMIPWSRNCPKDEEKLKTMDFGTAFHASMLEPQNFLDEYAIAPDAPKNTKAGKKIHADFQEEHGHKKILSLADDKKITLMRNSCLAHPTIKMIMDNATDFEVSYFVDHPELGIKMKCRPDIVGEINGNSFIGELKTIDKLDMIPRNVYNLKYHMSAAHYMECYHAEHGRYPDKYVFIFVSKSVELGRYPATCRSLPSHIRSMGHDLWEQAIQQYQYCRLNDRWLSWPDIEFEGWMK